MHGLLAVLDNVDSFHYISTAQCTLPEVTEGAEEALEGLLTFEGLQEVAVNHRFTEVEDVAEVEEARQHTTT